jgi:HSP20 family protein
MNDFIEIKTRINTLLDELASRREPGTPAGSGEWSPRIDMYDLPERIVLRADVPGVSSDDLEIRLEGEQLVIRGSRKQPSDLDKEHLCRLERPFGGFARRYSLPSSADPEGIRAHCEDGVLEVVVRKREPSTSKRISVEKP